MSYDLIIFRPKSNVSLDWINTFLMSDEANDENADQEAVDAKYIDVEIGHNELTSLVAGPMIQALCDQDYTQDEIDEWIEEPDYDSELAECMETVLEYHEGYKIMISIAGMSKKRRLPEKLWESFEELHDRGLCVFDPQLGRVLDIGDDHEEFVESFKELSETYEDEDDYNPYGEDDDEEY